jgi:hypothetical protein
MALEDVPGVVRLVVPDSGKEVARLTAPDASRLVPICFTRDGRRLVCRATESETLSIFDLGLIRAQLAALGLDWDAPPCPAGSDAVADHLDVRLVGTDLLALLAAERTDAVRAKSDSSPDEAKPNATKKSAESP